MNMYSLEKVRYLRSAKANVILLFYLMQCFVGIHMVVYVKANTCLL